MAGYPMFQNQYLTNARDTLKLVLDNRAEYGYDLQPVYADIFDITKYETNNELMVYIQGAGNEYLRTGMHGFFYNYNGMLHPTREVAEGTKVFSFDENTPDTIPMRQDIRRATAFKVLTTVNGVTSFQEPDASVVGNLIYVGKWLDYEQRDYPRNVFAMLRFSEAVLLYDEVVCMLQDESKRQDVVNHIRSFRKRGGYYEPIRVNNNSWEELYEDLKLERRRELLFESHRRLDLVRWGIYIPTKKKSLAFQFNTLDNVWDYISGDHLCLYPVPLYEFNTNGLLGEQNPGYGGK
jgi:hypothetical protein